MDAAEVHRAVIDVLVVQAAAGCATFAELLGRLPGAPPDEAASALDRLASLGLVDPAAAARLAPSAHLVSAGEDGEYLDSVLPPPHPLDYDWRFTLATAESLCSCCVQFTRSGDTIALLGTPTVLSAAALTPQGRRWVLLESSPATTDALTRIAPDVLQCDLSCDDLPSLDARVVVADPPWYAENTSVFLWAASRLSRVGATVLLAQPPLATRPGILAERASLLAFARHTGLELEAIRPGVLGYTCPPFECRALEASGLSRAVPATWRRGDLLVLRRMAAPAAARPALDAREDWREVVLHGARIRFRLDQPAPENPVDPRLCRLVDGDVLASVSRRDPLRSKVAVWTGGNRVYGCRAPGLLAVIAAATAAGGPVIGAAERHMGRAASTAEQARIMEAVCQLAEVARAEIATSRIPPGRADSIVVRQGLPADGTSRPGPVAGRYDEDSEAARSAS